MRAGSGALLSALLLLGAAPAARGEDHAAGPLQLPARDAQLQLALDRELARLPFAPLVRRGAISISLVDLSDPAGLRYAATDDDHMRYAASLPKIAIMLGIFDRVVANDLAYTPELRELLERMIRRSDNAAATELIRRIGFESIAATLEDPRYRLYDPRQNGGLWVGKDYGGPLGYWHRDPLHHISHGATTRQVARFFVMLDRRELISPWASTEMKRILGRPEIKHKFVRGLLSLPRLLMFRKSGTWRTWHADAALVEHDGKRYVAAALVESPEGESVLTALIQRLDALCSAPPVKLAGRQP